MNLGVLGVQVLSYTPCPACISALMGRGPLSFTTGFWLKRQMGHLSQLMRLAADPRFSHMSDLLSRLLGPSSAWVNTVM